MTVHVESLPANDRCEATVWFSAWHKGRCSRKPARSIGGVGLCNQHAGMFDKRGTLTLWRGTLRRKAVTAG